MNRIQTQTKGIRPIRYVEGGNDLSIYTYLKDVEYQVKAHFEWNMNRPDLEEDRNEDKHYQIALRQLQRGGRRDVFLGTRECQGSVEPCTYGEGNGVYDDTKELAFGTMVHGLTYPDENGKGELQLRLWSPVMRKGRIVFPRPEECRAVKTVKKQSMKQFVLKENLQPADELFKEEGLG